MKRILTFILPLLLLSVMFSGCGKKLIKSESVLDTPETHYAQGMRLFDRGDLTGAADEFDRAIGMNPRFSPGYEGKALVKAWQSDYKSAYGLLDKSINLDKENWNSWVSMARVQAREAADDWLKKARKSLDKAEKISPDNEKIQYWRGDILARGFDFSGSLNALFPVIAKKGEYAGRANKLAEKVQKIVRAVPGTKYGKQIALQDEVDRADMAVLFVEELKILEVLTKNQPKDFDTGFQAPTDPMKMDQATVAPGGATDIKDHWAYHWIQDVLDVGAMELYPDHTFHPDAMITRGEYAQLIQHLIITITRDPSLATRFIGEQSHFPDVNSSHPLYNAIALCTSRGIMEAQDMMTGEFGLMDQVSGADALLIIREFQNSLRMTF